MEANKGSRKGIDPKVTAGVDPDPKVTAGVDPDLKVTAGVDPDLKVTTGVDPDPKVTARVDPDPKTRIIVDSGNKISSGVEPALEQLCNVMSEKELAILTIIKNPDQELVVKLAIVKEQLAKEKIIHLINLTKISIPEAEFFYKAQE